jgi:WD40 repeat protein
MTRLLHDTLEDWAGEVRVPHDLADRALRRRAWKPVGAAALVMAMVAGVALFVAVQGRPEPVVRPATGVTLPARPSPAPTDVRTDTENSPPARLITAGRMAVSAYYTTRREATSADLERIRRTWSLYDPRTGGYERTPYAWVDVAPGLQVAAVLEGDLLSRRLGVLDMNTREVLSWIDLEHQVASVTWSPDGKRILATAYSSYPDVLRGRGDQASPTGASSRTGYYVVDVEDGTADYHELPPLPGHESNERIINPNGRQDLGWSLDGTMIWAPTTATPDRLFYSLDGEPQDAPEGQRYRRWSSLSAISPDGRLALGPDGLPTKITEVGTGKVAGRQRVLQLHAWADDDNVIALGCAGTCGNEFNTGLVLVSVDGSRMTQLTADHDSTESGARRWVLTPR